MRLAGTPPTIAYGGIFLVTTALAPIIAPSPIVRPEIITAPSPIQTSLPTFVRCTFSKVRSNSGCVESAETLCLAAPIEHRLPIEQYRPMSAFRMTLKFAYDCIPTVTSPMIWHPLNTTPSSAITPRRAELPKILRPRLTSLEETFRISYLTALVLRHARRSTGGALGLLSVTKK